MLLLKKTWKAFDPDIHSKAIFDLQTMLGLLLYALMLGHHFELYMYLHD